MRKRILTVAALAAALATSLVIGSTTVGAQEDIMVYVFKTNDANGNGIFTDDEVVDPMLGTIEHRITIVNDSDVEVTILKVTDDIIDNTEPCDDLLDLLVPGDHESCTLDDDDPVTATRVNTVTVEIDVAGVTIIRSDSTIVRPATIQLFNVRINVAGTLVEGEVENLTLMVTDTSGPIAEVTIGPSTATVTGTVKEPTVFLTVGMNVEMTATAKPGSTFTSWSMEGTTAEGGGTTGTQLDLDIREITVKLKVKPGKGKLLAKKREANVEFGVLFAPLGDKFEADLDLSGEIHADPQP